MSTMVSPTSSHTARLAMTKMRWAVSSDAWASASSSLWYTTSCPKSAADVAAGRLGQRGDLLLRVAVGVELGDLGGR